MGEKGMWELRRVRHVEHVYLSFLGGLCVCVWLHMCEFDYRARAKQKAPNGEVGLTRAHSLATYLITGTSNFLSLNKEEIG